MIWIVETYETEWRPTAQNWPNRKMARAHAEGLRKRGFRTRVKPYARVLRSWRASPTGDYYIVTV